MDRRVTEFVRGLRAAGVRVSLAEALDGLRALRAVGVGERESARLALRAAVVKDHADHEAFDALFPLYFAADGPPLQDALDDLSPDDADAVRAALEAMAGRLEGLLDWLTRGDGPTPEELAELARRAAERSGATDPSQARWISRALLRDMGMERLESLLAQLRARLREAGLGEEAIDHVLGVARANRDALAEQVARQVGLAIARQREEQPPDAGDDGLLQQPLQSLRPGDAARLRVEVTRLVARLRSRAALRQRRARTGRPDPRRTFRANLRHGGVPMELKVKRRRLKPDLVLIADVSTSMRPVAEFMLRLIYELGDQVARARSFAFNEDIEEITPSMRSGRAAEAVAEVLYAIPPGHYATDLGRSLATFHQRHLGTIGSRTTVIVLGDGRNNHRSPREDLLRDLRRRARRLIWLNPEARGEWGTGDSDMLRYEPCCDAVYPVRNLAQLAAAVDRLLGDAT